MAALTQRQEEILNFIIKKMKEKGYPPSVREIGANVGLASTSTVHAHLTRLEAKGIIRKDPSKPRTLEIIDPDYAFNTDPNVVDVPIFNELSREASPEGYFKVSKDIAGGESTFILKATNNLTKPNPAFIDGDLIIVRGQRTAKSGDIVLTGNPGAGEVKDYKEEDDVIGKVIGMIRLFED